MNDLTSKMNGVTVEEALAATEADLALAAEVAQACEMRPGRGSAAAAAAGETA
jgi:hypothetical protein